ncbi:MAG: pro-sigmaK processing inhibitor BofA family protein [Bacilli bacterium]|nr:pro-sigmaK processing inhibitor BofA family protein [Bacilli bacterium]
MKNIKIIVRNVVLAAFILYGYNLIAVNFNMMVPVNFITLGSVTFLGAPALVALVLFKIIIL